MSKNRKYKPRTEAQKAARRERDRKRREAMKRQEPKTAKVNQTKKQIATKPSVTAKVSISRCNSPLRMIAVAFEIIADAMAIVVNRADKSKK